MCEEQEEGGGGESEEVQRVSWGEVVGLEAGEGRSRGGRGWSCPDRV